MRIIAIILSALAVLLFTACAVHMAMPVAGWVSSIVALIWATSLLRLRPPRQQVGRLLAFAAICLALAAWHLAPGSSRSAFLERLHRIRPGMTVDEAQEIMAGYKEGTGVPAVPSADGREAVGEFTIRDALVFRHSDEPEYNADWGIVYFTDGRVTRVEFDPD